MKRSVLGILFLALFQVNFHCCFSATLEQYYANIYNNMSSMESIDVFFKSAADNPTILTNVTKHALKHIKVVTELRSDNLERSIVSWLVYKNWENRIANLRKLVCNLYDLTSNVRIIQQWINNDLDNVDSAETENQKCTCVTQDVIRSIERIKVYSSFLEQNKCCILGNDDETTQDQAILHTYSVNGQLTNNYDNDVFVINMFIDAAKNITINSDISSTKQDLRRLIQCQTNLFDSINLMTSKVLHDCFEPCVKAFLIYSFSLSGMTLEQALESKEKAFATTKSYDGVSISYNETVQDNKTLQNDDRISINNNSTIYASVNVLRKFDNGAQFTQLVRAIVFVTKYDNSFPIADGVCNISDDILNKQDSKRGTISVMSVAKAQVEIVNNHLTSNNMSHVYTNCNSEFRKVVNQPFISTIYTK